MCILCFFIIPSKVVLVTSVNVSMYKLYFLYFKIKDSKLKKGIVAIHFDAHNTCVPNFC